MKKILLTLTALGLSLGAQAQSLVTKQQLHQFAQEDHQASLATILHLDAEIIEQRLKGYSDARGIWLRKLLIDRLSQQEQLTVEQRSWLIKQFDSDHILMAHLPDSGHELPVSVVNIPAKAKGLIAHFSAIDKANHWRTIIQEEQFEWSTLFAQSVTLQRPETALTYLMRSLEQSQLQSLVTELLAKPENQANASNLVLKLLAEYSQDQQQQQSLYPLIWQNRADEHSIHAVKQLTQSQLAQSTRIELLKQAANNQQLTSLAFNLLAKHFNEHKNALDHLFDQLSYSNNSAMAAAALATIDNSTVQSRLKQGIYSPDKVVAKASKLALSLSNNKEQD